MRMWACPWFLVIWWWTLWPGLSCTELSKDLCMAVSSSSLNSENPYATIKDLPIPQPRPLESSYMEMKSPIQRERSYVEIRSPPLHPASTVMGKDGESGEKGSFQCWDQSCRLMYWDIAEDEKGRRALRGEWLILRMHNNSYWPLIA